MVMLQKEYITEEIISSGSRNVWIDDGWHKGTLVKSSIEKPLTEGKPQDLVLTIVITEGKFVNTEMEERLAISDETPIKADNPTWTWAKAAFNKLGQLATAVGVDKFSDTTVLHNKAFLFETKTKKGIDKQTGQEKPEWNKSIIYGYKAIPAVGVASAPAFAQAAAAPAAAQPPVVAPWAK